MDGVAGGNVSQTVKEIAIQKGIDVPQFSAIATPNQCKACKCKLPEN